MTIDKFLIAGLGNPGFSYAKTRHNAGTWWIQAASQQFNFSLNLEKKFNLYLAKINFSTEIGPAIELYFLVPNTYMNLSGQPIANFMQYYNIPAETVLIVHDDLDLPIGSAKLKLTGGHQGHNGLRDIILHLGGNGNFKRIRLGIGHPGNKALVHDYVLGIPAKAEQQLIQTAITNSLNILPDIISNNWQLAVNKLHNSSK